MKSRLFHRPFRMASVVSILTTLNRSLGPWVVSSRDVRQVLTWVTFFLVHENDAVARLRGCLAEDKRISWADGRRWSDTT